MVQIFPSIHLDSFTVSTPCPLKEHQKHIPNTAITLYNTWASQEKRFPARYSNFPQLSRKRCCFSWLRHHRLHVCVHACMSVCVGSFLGLAGNLSCCSSVVLEMPDQVRGRRSLFLLPRIQLLGLNSTHAIPVSQTAPLTILGCVQSRCLASVQVEI